MRGRLTELWTYLLVTAVTVLIWAYASAETRVEQEVSMQVKLRVPHSSRWVIIPKDVLNVTIVANGSQRAVSDANRLERLEVDLPAIEGVPEVDIPSLIRTHPELARTGIAVRSIELAPNPSELSLMEMTTAPARVSLELPRIETVKPPTITPTTIQVELPARSLRSDRPIVLTPVVNAADLAALPPGEPHSIVGALRGEAWFERLREADRATVDPLEVRIDFTISTKSVAVEPRVPVRVQIAGSPEDEYHVALDPKVIRDVSVIAPAELGAQIASGDVPVFAVLYLKTSEKEVGITSKPVTFFVAIRPDGTAQMVKATVAGSDQPPEVAITITDLAKP